MSHALPALLRGLIATSLLVLNTLFWVPVLLLVALLKLVVAGRRMRLWVDPLLLRNA